MLDVYMLLPNNPISETIFSRTAQLRGEFPHVLRMICGFATFFFVVLFDLHIMHRACRRLLPRACHFTRPYALPYMDKQYEYRYCIHWPFGRAEYAHSHYASIMADVQITQ